jgi:hypothetical protein
MTSRSCSALAISSIPAPAHMRKNGAFWKAANSFPARSAVCCDVSPGQAPRILSVTTRSLW